MIVPNFVFTFQFFISLGIICTEGKIIAIITIKRRRTGTAATRMCYHHGKDIVIVYSVHMMNAEKS